MTAAESLARAVEAGNVAKKQIMTAKNLERSRNVAFIQIEDALKIQSETLAKEKAGINKGALFIVEGLLKFISEIKSENRDLACGVDSPAEALDRFETDQKEKALIFANPELLDKSYKIKPEHGLAIAKVLLAAIAETKASNESKHKPTQPTHNRRQIMTQNETNKAEAVAIDRVAKADRALSEAKNEAENLAVLNSVMVVENADESAEQAKEKATADAVDQAEKEKALAGEALAKIREKS